MLRIVTIVLLIALLAGCVPISSVTSTLPAPEVTAASAEAPAGEADVDDDPNLFIPQPSDEGLIRDRAFTDATSIFTLKTNPPRFRLQILGAVPTSCHVPRITVAPADAEGRINIVTYSLVETDAVPIPVLKHFTATISLDGNPAGQYEVFVNGEKVGDILAPEAIEQTSMKGWELYSWQESGAWQYALLIGTNRNKTWDEITASAVRLASVDAVEASLAKLNAGEFVTWNQVQYPEAAYPPDEVVTRLQTFSQERRLIFNVTMLQ